MMSPAVLTTELRRRWSDLGLTARFSLVSALIIVCGMLAVGEWVAHRIADGVVHNHAASAALCANGIAKLQVQALNTDAALSKETIQFLDELTGPPAIARQIVGFRIWKGDTIVYSERLDLIGRTQPPSLDRTRALAGEVVAVYRIAGVASSAPTAAAGEWLLIVYAPVREIGTNRIIALTETYEIAHALRPVIKECIYRFLQEGLSNALRHAGGRSHRVRCHVRNKTLEISVLDAGPGLGTDPRSGNGHALGLKGLRDRVEALGGELSIGNRREGGTKLTASFAMLTALAEEPLSHD